MAAPSKVTGQRAEPFPSKALPKPAPRMSGDLLVMAALIGISRVLFSPSKQGPVARTNASLQEIRTA